MAYLRNWGDIQVWMQDCGIQRWSISRTQAAQDNNNVFVYDKDKSEEENKLICERALERFAGDVLYITGWRTKEAKTGGFSAIILYDKNGQQTPPSQQVGGLYGVGGSIDIAGLTADIEQRISNRYEKERLERLEKELHEEKRDLENQKNSAMGIIAQTLAPFAQQLAGKLAPMRNVAGTPTPIDAEEDITAAKIRAQEASEENEEQPDEIEIFCEEEEYNRMMAIMKRFAEVEPQWLDLLESVTRLAEANDNMYLMAKQSLLK